MAKTIKGFQLMFQAIQAGKAPIYGTRSSVRIETTKGSRQITIQLRIDGRNNEWRVDFTTGLGPWEAIDGGAGNIHSYEEAIACATRWLVAAREQSTLQPRVQKEG